MKPVPLWSILWSNWLKHSENTAERVPFTRMGIGLPLAGSLTPGTAPLTRSSYERLVQKPPWGEEPVLDPASGACSNKTVGLIGLHIVQKTPSRPQWNFLIRSESPGLTLQATILVDDVLMKLLYGAPVDWQDRAHFFAVAARQMRCILIDHARTTKAQKRISRGKRLPLDAVTLIAHGCQHEVLEIDQV